MSEKMIRKQIYLQEQHNVSLRKLAKQYHTTEAEIIRRAIEDYAAKENVAHRIDPMLELVGMVSEGPADGSVNHDHYIYGKKNI